MLGYLVAFVTDPVDDELAGAVREAVRGLAASRTWEVAPPGYFDDPDAPDGEHRTMGTYLRPRAPEADVVALCGMVQDLSAAHGVTFEVQLAEMVIGRVTDGEADFDLARGLPGFA